MSGRLNPLQESVPHAGRVHSPAERSDSANERLEIALAYLAFGWALIPLAKHSKDPHFGLLPTDANGKAIWRPLALRPATAPEVRDWFARDPECNIGILTGEVSGGLVVADFDYRIPHLPLTAIAATKRGQHGYFRSARRLKSCDIRGGELKAEGGYVVAPPSIHPSGCEYTWFDGLAPWDADLRELPCGAEWLGEVSDAPLRDPRQVFENLESRDDGLGVARKIVSCYGGLAGGDEAKANGLLTLAASPEAALRVMRHLGSNVDAIGRNFLCPLLGHEERNPSAALWHQDGKPIMLHCFHHDEWWFLPDLYASHVTGKLQVLSRGVRALWWLRALHEAGITLADPLSSPTLPEDAPRMARKLYEGFCYALRLRTLYDHRQTAMPFTWSFAMHWCCIGSMTTVGEAQRWLLENRYLTLAREGVSGNRASRKATLLALGPGPGLRSGASRSAASRSHVARVSGACKLTTARGGSER